MIQPLKAEGAPLAESRTQASTSDRRVRQQSREHSLTNRVLRAGFWSLSLRSLTRGIGLLRNIFLARLLAPADMGLFGIALVILSIIDRFSNTGLNAALVQKDRDIGDYLDTVWTVQALRGLGLGAVLFLGSHWIVVFFGAPDAATLIQVLGLIMFIRGLENPGVLYYTRDLEFKREFRLACSELIPDLITSITLAVILRSAWALMLGMLIGKTSRMITSYVLHPYRPRLSYRHHQVRELGRYGRWIFLNNILAFLAYRGDNLFVGKMLGPAVLGVYMLAYSISEAVTVEIGRMASDVLFPAYSRVQSDVRRMQTGFLTAVDVVASISLPFAALLCTLGRPMTHLVFGPKWDGMAPLLAPLALAGVARVLVQNGSALCRGAGRPNAAFGISLAGVLSMYAVLFPLAHWFGAFGVALSVLVGMLASVPAFLIYARQLLQLRLSVYAKTLLPSVALAGSTALPLLVVGWPTASMSVRAVGETVALAAVAYVSTALLLWRCFRVGPLRIHPLLSDRRARKLADVTDAEVDVPSVVAAPI